MEKIDFHECNNKLLSTNKDMDTTTIKNLFNNFTYIVDTKQKPFRKINILIDGDGKKQATFDLNSIDPKTNKPYCVERNNWSLDAIEKEEKENGWIYKKCQKEGNSYSLYVKHIPKLYVVDFDTKELDGCELKDFLDKRKTLYTETQKGFHYYIFINDMIEYSNQQKVYKDDNFEIDLIKKNNIWETADRIVYGNISNINTFNWTDINHFFDVDKMNSVKKDKPVKKITDYKDENPKPSPPVSPISSDEEVVPEKKMTDKDFEKVKMALLKLNKNRAEVYDSWLNVGIALFNNGDNMDNKTMRLWEEFSKQCNEKYDEMACMNKWMTFKPRCNGLTIASIFHWLKEDNPEEHKKMEKKEVEINWKELYENNDGSFIKEMNKICMYYEVDGTILYYNKQKTLLRNKEAIARTFFKKDCFYIEEEGKKKKINPFDIWLEHDDRRDISEIIFKPTQNIGKIEDYKLNLWTGFKYKNTHDYQIERIQHILDHIKNVWACGDEELYEYFICWFARILQQPWNKNKVCIGLKSIEGVGKTCIFELFAEIIGKEYYMECTDLNKAFGQFNNQVLNKLLCVFNETNWGGDKKMKGKFKSFITDNRITIEQKGKDPFDIDCYCNCAITTNENWLVDVKGDDRRFNLIEIKHEVLDDDYYRKIHEFEYFQDLANYFYNYDISKYNPKKFKKSELHLDQVIQSQDSVELFITMMCEKDIVFSDNDDEELIICKNHFFERYNEQSYGTYGTKLNNVHFFRRLRSILPNCIKYVNNNKSNGKRIMISSLNNVIKEFDKYCGK